MGRRKKDTDTEAGKVICCRCNQPFTPWQYWEGGKYDGWWHTNSSNCEFCEDMMKMEES